MTATSDGTATDPVIAAKGYAHSDTLVSTERSSHTWFVLARLLGYDNVRNYDGSWTDWGSAVRAPIETGAPK